MKINVPEKYADLYIKALVERKKMLEAKIEDFKKEIEEIDSHVSAFTSMPIFNESHEYSSIKWESKGYRSEWPWTKKISYYEEFRGQLMTSNEVVDFIMDKEPDLIKTKVRSSVSAALSNRLKTETYIKFIDPISQTTYYGPKEW
ncbi:hypothetical protein E1176_00845, partial [Fulvivirga sp. RKSG066]|uniref:hypothetical protein n=1 Tax=Fulvivirga aurantia TaxID=2529383 RepID=UPI0012BD58EA